MTGRGVMSAGARSDVGNQLRCDVCDCVDDVCTELLVVGIN